MFQIGLKRQLPLKLITLKEMPAKGMNSLQTFLNLADPAIEYRHVVDYHRIRWLSLRDSLEVVCSVLWHLVGFFEDYQDGKLEVFTKIS